jgi:hypothetical protein
MDGRFYACTTLLPSAFHLLFLKTPFLLSYFELLSWIFWSLALGLRGSLLLLHFNLLILLQHFAGSIQKKIY